MEMCKTSASATRITFNTNMLDFVMMKKKILYKFFYCCIINEYEECVGFIIYYN